ncbi:Sulfatase [Butyrivibrio proteoclasticus]|uniref:Sulfatase n=1 Tax=Butyrivibrio proteoclasticus TaxID=43305 RepID=A0A1I5VV54_9FIRM|nr:sulfatase-like hydrolase/transferase [Butyrivibrio proteoclasticus]SFQ11454.1 Sulfatase [Butyrivibrio proteoclasticus]
MKKKDIQNYDLLIKELLERTGIYFVDADIECINDFLKNIVDILTELFRCICKAEVVIRGGGEETKFILETLYSVDKSVLSNITGVIDNYSNKKEMYGIPVFDINGVSLDGINKCIICSFNYRYEMRCELESKYPSIEIIDIYDVLASEGFFFDSSFFNRIDPRCFYLKINYFRKLSESQEGENPLFLKKLICAYISIRDFYNAIKYIDKYNRLFCDGLLLFRNELQELMNRLKEDILNIEGEHIVWLWLDQLRYCDLDHMEYTNSLKNECVSFEKCYTENLQTSTTFKMMFSGKDVLDGKAYEIDTINSDNSPLYNYLKQKGYDFRYIGWGKNNIYFDGISSYSLEKDNCIISLNIWKMLMDMLRNNTGKSLYLLHSFESHEHHYCGMMTQSLYNVWDSSFEAFCDRYYECIQYIDAQLMFYMPIIKKRFSFILMSDHGQELENVYKFDENVNPLKEKYVIGRWSENSLHTVMIVKSKYFGHRKFMSLFSLVDFLQIVRSIIDEKWMVEEKEYIKIQSMPFYNEGGLKKIKEAKDYKFAMLVKGILKGTGKYLKYASGEEEYYVNGDDYSNEINEQKYKEEIDCCRKLCGEIDYTIFDEDKYCNAFRLLKEYEKLRVYNEKGGQ